MILTNNKLVRLAKTFTFILNVYNLKQTNLIDQAATEQNFERNNQYAKLSLKTLPGDAISLHCNTFVAFVCLQRLARLTIIVTAETFARLLLSASRQSIFLSDGICSKSTFLFDLRVIYAETFHTQS